MEKIVNRPIVATKRGLPALWEDGGGTRNGGATTLIAKPDGSKPKATYTPRGGHLSNGQHALVCIHPGYLIVDFGWARRDGEYIEIWRVIEANVNDVDGENFEAVAKVERINFLDDTVEKGAWETPLDPELEAIVEAARAKASVYHCREPFYVEVSPRPAPRP